MTVAVITLAVVLSCASTAFAQAPAAEARYALIVQGASGGEPYATRHREWLDRLEGALRDKLGIESSKLFVLAEKPGDGELPATAESVRTTIAKVGSQIQERDLLLVVLIGHGTGDRTDGKFNLVGPDLAASEWAALLKPVTARVAVVNTTAASFPFLKHLAAPGRVVITATNSTAQRFDTVFPGAFIDALTAETADADKNGRVSLFEAYQHAVRLVEQHYEQAGTINTEKAVFDDTGEGVARNAVVAGEAPGTVASVTYLDAPKAATSSDPEMQRLLQRQQALTQQLDDLRRRRPTMSAEEYDAAYEKLIVELATVSAEIRKRGGDT